MSPFTIITISLAVYLIVKQRLPTYTKLATTKAVAQTSPARAASASAQPGTNLSPASAEAQLSGSLM